MQRLAAVSQAPLVLRDYQLAAVEAIWKGLADEAGNILAVLPTGTGKALVICEFVRRASIAYPQVRILIVTHSKELVRQNFEEMIRLWPAAPAGIHSAGLKSRDVQSAVIFGSIQSMHRKAYDLQQVDIIIVDEAQSIPRKTNTTWLKFFADVKKINPYMRVVGLTATAYRLDSGMLHLGEGAMFDRVVYEYSILDAIKGGYLATPISVSAATQIDTTGVGVRGGDYIPGQLDAVASDPATVEAIAKELVEHGKDRRGWIVFGAGVSHCEMLRDAILRLGYSCEGVFAITPPDERDAIIEAFKRQEIRCLVSVNALSVGFNARHVDLVGLARPTQSVGRYIQSCGRGMRTFPDKTDCLILDFGNNIRRHGPIDMPNVKNPGPGGGDVPIKICENCGFENFIAARVCAQCGAPFEIEGSKLNTKASTAPLLSIQALPQWCDVITVRYARHVKVGKPDSLKVTYQCGFVWHNEWICLQHIAYARSKAEAWWRQRSPGTSIPGTVGEALQRVGELRKPIAVQVRTVGKFTEIVAVRFA